MALVKLLDMERSMKISQLISLGEEQRRIYDCLRSCVGMRGTLKESYEHHQREMELLIKYQKRMRK